MVKMWDGRKNHVFLNHIFLEKPCTRSSVLQQFFQLVLCQMSLFVFILFSQHVLFLVNFELTKGLGILVQFQIIKSFTFQSCCIMVILIITIILLKIISTITDHDCYLRNYIRMTRSSPISTHIIYLTSPSFLIYYINKNTNTLSTL